MNAPAFPSSNLYDCQPVRCDEISIWRGRFIEEFALGETLVSEALVQLAQVSKRHAKTLLRHPGGQRFAALESLVAPTGPLAVEGRRVAQVLREWRGLHPIRAYLCHGSSVVTFDQHGRWRVALHLLTLGGSEKVVRTEMALTESEAAAKLQEITSARLRLEGQLRGMLASFK